MKFNQLVELVFKTLGIWITITTLFWYALPALFMLFWQTENDFLALSQRDIFIILFLILSFIFIIYFLIFKTDVFIAFLNFKSSSAADPLNISINSKKTIQIVIVLMCLYIIINSLPKIFITTITNLNDTHFFKNRLSFTQYTYDICYNVLAIVVMFSHKNIANLIHKKTSN